MLIALIGLDGAGKTTISKLLDISLRKQGLKVCVIQPFRYFLLKPVVAAARIVVKLLRRSSNKDSHPLLFKGQKTLFVRQWPYLVALDNLLYYIISIKPKLLLGYYVISDRYFYDLAINFDYYGYSSACAGRFYRHVIPKPDIAFVLDISPDIAMLRANELDIMYFREQRERYLELAREFGLRVIDVERPVQKVLGDIESVLLSQFPLIEDYRRG